VERHRPPSPSEVAVDLSTRAQQAWRTERARERERTWAGRKATLTLVIAALTLAALMYQAIPREVPRTCSAVVADMLQLRSAKADGLIIGTRYLEALAVLRRQETECRWR
jgi:hypothetical protein